MATSRRRKRRRETTGFEAVRSSVEAALVTCGRMFGYTSIRDEQKDAIVSFVEGNDVFVTLPTGYGKSFCYFCLPSLFDKFMNKDSWSLALVVSPLIALMTDQVHSLTGKGIAAALCSRENECETTKSLIADGKCQIVFATSEVLFDKNWVDIFQCPSFRENLVSFVVDEAHCVKKWGKDFRKEFSKLGELRSLFPSNVHVMALTTTASRKTQKEVIRTLGMRNPVMITKSPDKPNIYYSVSPKSGTIDEAFEPLIQEVRQSQMQTRKTIIFCRTLQDCSDLYLLFKSELGEEFTHPIGAPNYTQFRLVEMFSACNTPALKHTPLLIPMDT